MTTAIATETYADNYCGAVWIVKTVSVAALEQTLCELERTHPAASNPVLTYIDIERVLVAWRCWAKPSA